MGPGAMTVSSRANTLGAIHSHAVEGWVATRPRFPHDVYEYRWKQTSQPGGNNKIGHVGDHPPREVRRERLDGTNVLVTVTLP